MAGTRKGIVDRIYYSDENVRSKQDIHDKLISDANIIIKDEDNKTAINIDDGKLKKGK